MVVKKKIWVCLLLYACLYSYADCRNHSVPSIEEISLDETSSNKLSFTASSTEINDTSSDFTKRENTDQTIKFSGTVLVNHSSEESSTSTRLENPVTKNVTDRRGYERDLLVVLPVMQGNSDLSNSNLQMLYTKAPVTAIIGEESKDLRQQADRSTTTHEILKKRIDHMRLETTTAKHDEGVRHPYTGFLFTKLPPKIHRSPLDYGYPESFKFVQELNELPKNHKPEWALADIPDGDTDSSPTQATNTPATKGDPFQMFESVKPLEINKLLSFKPASGPVTNSIIEETTAKPRTGSTEASNSFSKRPLYKRPMKKPQKNKLNSQKLGDIDAAKFVSLTAATTTTNNPPTTTNTITTSSTSFLPAFELESDLYNAARYTPLFAQSTKVFLPTPYVSASEKENANTIIRNIETKPVPSAAEILTTSTISNTNPIAPNFQWTNFTTFSADAPASYKVSGVNAKPSDIVSLTKILGENFESKDYLAKMPPPKELTTKSPFAVDMLTNDMKNMLVALGILKSESQPSMFDLMTTTTTTTTTAKPTNPEYILQNLFSKRQQMTPVIDPNSYVMFKKIPSDFENARDKLPVSDEMKDLLASFGLLPKKPPSFTNSIMTRMSRQNDFDKFNETMSPVLENETITTDEKLSPGNVSASGKLVAKSLGESLENLSLLKPLAYHYQRDGHVFQPTIELEKYADEHKVRKINDVIDTIRKLSDNKAVDDLSLEELEKQLRNVTALLKEENLVDDDETPLLSDTEDLKHKLGKMSNTSAITTTQINEYTGNVHTLENSTSFKYSDVNHTSDESVISLLKFSNNTSRASNESNVVMNPPNPLSTEELQNFLEFNKNNVKRQESNDSSTASTSLETTVSSISESADSSTRATENNNASFPDLEASFGGGDTVTDEPSSDDLPTLKPNGLYFYLDWNSFLNVGETERNPIRIRFSPRAGNPRHFVNITVP